MRRREILQGLSVLAGSVVLPSLARASEARCNVSVHSPVSGTSPGHESSRERLQRALNSGFGIQYWGVDYSPQALSRTPHGVLIVEATRIGAVDSGTAREVLFNRDEIEAIQQDGKRLVLGYVNLTEIETYRDYWVRASRSASAAGGPDALPWSGPSTSAGERLAAYWHPEWEAILFERIDQILSIGADGIFLDDLLHYFSFLSAEDLDWSNVKSPQALGGHGAYAASMLRLVTRMSAHLRKTRPDAIVIVNNGVFLLGDAASELGGDLASLLFDEYASSIDGILVESLFGVHEVQGTHTILAERFAQKGIGVLTVDFASQFPDLPATRVRTLVGQRSAAHGFFSYIADDDAFDRLYPPSLPRGSRETLSCS